MDNKENTTRTLTYKALLLYSLVGGCFILNLLNYLELVKFNNELSKNIDFYKKIHKKKKKISVEF